MNVEKRIQQALFHLVAESEFVRPDLLKIHPSNPDLLEEIIEEITCTIPKFSNKYSTSLSKSVHTEKGRWVYLLQIIPSPDVPEESRGKAVYEFKSHIPPIVNNYKLSRNKPKKP